MTDKQIIIDGVDVSWCKHYKHNDKNSGWSSCTSKDEEHIHAVNPLCCENKDCLYKQLKRIEQECEELKKQLERKEENYQKLLNKSNKYIHNLVDENVQDISNLARQLEQLKAENETYKKMLEDEDVRLALNEIRTGERKLWFNKAERLKQALAEIKEIAEIEIECKTYEIENDCFNETRCKALNEHIDFIKQILQKISEVENE